MSTCKCGEAELGATSFALVEHRLHGAAACAQHHTFGEVVRAVVDGVTSASDVALTLGPEADRRLVDEALAQLRDAGVLRFVHVIGGTTAVHLAEGIASVADAERKLATGEGPRAGDYAA